MARCSRMLTIMGKRKPVVQWAGVVSAATILKRLDAGWDAEDAVLTPSQRKTAHLKQLPEHHIWTNMCARCRPGRSKAKYYGDRGIRVCKRWANPKRGYLAFLEDMGRRPSNAHSIDRIDPEGPYSPKNCRWATSAEQARNRRNTAMLTVDGVTRPLVEWAERAGVTPTAIRHRLSRGESPRDAVRPRSTKHRHPRIPITDAQVRRAARLHDEGLSYRQIARRLGLRCAPTSLAKRVRRHLGLVPEK